MDAKKKNLSKIIDHHNERDKGRENITDYRQNEELKITD